MEANGMTGTETAAASGWLIGKLAPALGGLFGGLSLAMFWTPEKLREKGKVASVFIAGGISAMAGFSFTGAVAMWMGVPSDKLDMVIGLAWLLGLSSIAIMNWLANYMSKREHMDIGEVAEDMKRGRERLQGNTPPVAQPRARTPSARKSEPVKAPPRKRTPAKKVSK
jgi:hypothetical protein